MKQHDNILCFEVERFGPGAWLIFDPDGTSLGYYNNTHGVEWHVKYGQVFHCFKRVPVEHKNAVIHWMFDYVDRLPHSLIGDERVFGLANAGKYDEVFTILKDKLQEYMNGR